MLFGKCVGDTMQRVNLLIHLTRLAVSGLDDVSEESLLLIRTRNCIRATVLCSMVWYWQSAETRQSEATFISRHDVPMTP